MFYAAADDTLGIYVFLFTDGEASQTDPDADYGRYVTLLADLVERAHAGTVPSLHAVVIVDPGAPSPNAVWRQRIAEIGAQAPKGTALALVSTNAMVRGVATALKWLKPQPYTRTAVASFADALAWMATQRPEVEARFTELHADVRRQAASG